MTMMTNNLLSRALHRRAILEGWYIFSTAHGDQVQRIDTQDHPHGDQLTDDDQALGLAIAAGIRCDPDTGNLDLEEKAGADVRTPRRTVRPRARVGRGDPRC